MSVPKENQMPLAPVNETEQMLPVANPGAVTPGELMDVLKSSLYPGASDSSLGLVISYCAAAKLDVMQKPVHIVPMWNKDAGRMVDVIMPGIGLYRVQAARSGLLAGISAPEYGPLKKENLGGVELEFPEWCRVTVQRRLVTGELAEFTGQELWKENYATAKRDTKAPNSMWMRRPFAQIAKCAEAQALRRAFPEMCGVATAEEMEGRVIHDREAPPKNSEPRDPFRKDAMEMMEQDAADDKWQDYYPDAWQEEVFNGERLGDLDDSKLGPKWKMNKTCPPLCAWVAGYITKTIRTIPDYDWSTVQDAISGTPDDITECGAAALAVICTLVKKARDAADKVDAGGAQ